MVVPVQWKIAIYHLPSEPTRHRVGVWREFVKSGALSLQNEAWAVPVGPGTDELIERIRDLVTRAEGQLLLFDSEPDERSAVELERLYTKEIESAWIEFIDECGKFEREIEREFEKQKFTLAELDEEEQNLEHLRRWHRDLRFRDHFGAASADWADSRLEDSIAELERLASAVFVALQNID
jgi:hypothetical protein